jgi:ribose transport system substrate-binding protein
MLDQDEMSAPDTPESEHMAVKSVSRRNFLKLAGIGGATIGATLGLGGLLAACGGGTTTSTAATGGTGTTAGGTATTATGGTATTVSAGAKKFKIALAMSYIGNTWQQQAQNLVVAESRTPPYDGLVDMKVFIAGTNLQTQISQLQDIVAAGYDGIICYPLTPTGLDQVFRDAVSKGVVIVNYDNVIETPGTYYVSIDQNVLGQKAMQWLADAMGGKGKLFLCKGVPGTYVDTARNDGCKSILDKYPDIKVVADFNGMWDDATAQKESQAAIAAHPDVQGIWSQAGCLGILQSLKAAGINKLFPMADEGENGWRLSLVDPALKAQGLSGCSIGSPVYTGALALKLCVKILQGGKVEQANVPDSDLVTSDKIVIGLDPAQGANTFPANRVPPNFYADWYNVDLCPELSIDSCLSGVPTPGATAKLP